MMAVLIVVASFATSASASAAAQVVKTNYCEPFFNTNLTVCYDTHLVTAVTETPSGNLSSTYSYRYNITLRGPGCNQDLQGAERGHFLWTQDGTQEQNFIAQSTSNAVDCGPESGNCTYSQHLHYANGAYQLSRYEVVCAEP
jgi:hypothetical protein